MSPQIRTDLHTMVTQLVEPHTNRQRVEYRRGTTLFAHNHAVKSPSLLEQLRATRSASGDERHNHGFGSRPPHRLDALDALARIDLAASRWVKDLGEDDPDTTEACIRLLGGLYPSTEEPTQRAIERDVRSWWTQARILTGWDTAPWKPDNTCPLCGRRGGLRVRLNDHSALCVECHELWTPETIGLLAEHIRTENGENDDTSGRIGA